MKILNILMGIIIGIILSAIVMYASVDKIMMVEDVSAYNHATTVEMLIKGAKSEGWKVPTVHNLQKTLKKHNIDISEVTVIEFCQPKHAAKILTTEGGKSVSPMMPCRVSVYEDNGVIYISRMNSGLIAKMFPNKLGETIGDASNEIESIIKNVVIKP